MSSPSQYGELLKDPRWQKRRLQIMERDIWRCRACCNTQETLCVHHLEYDGRPWEASDDMLVTLCSKCHDAIRDLENPGEVLAECVIGKTQFTAVSQIPCLNCVTMPGTWLCHRLCTKERKRQIGTKFRVWRPSVEGES